MQRKLDTLKNADIDFDEDDELLNINKRCSELDELPCTLHNQL